MSVEISFKRLFYILNSGRHWTTRLIFSRFGWKQVKFPVEVRSSPERKDGKV
jgi:hypothetical protein